MSTKPVGALARHHHVVLLVAAGAASAATLAAVLVLFERAGPREWIAASPESLEQLAHCEALADRGQRQRCAQELVADHVLRARGQATLAQR